MVPTPDARCASKVGYIRKCLKTATYSKRTPATPCNFTDPEYSWFQGFSAVIKHISRPQAVEVLALNVLAHTAPINKLGRVVLKPINVFSYPNRRIYFTNPPLV
jgi:hypothetical protein